MAKRRQVLMALGAGVSSVASFSAWGQGASGNYPTKPIKILVPYAVGTASDTIARQVAKALTEKHGWTVVVDNRAGANGAIGTAEGAKAAPDGHTLTLGVQGTLAMNPHLYKKLPYTPADFVGVAGLLVPTYFLTAAPSFPANTIPELIAEAKRRPGGINYGTYGVGSGSHLCGESLNIAAGVKMNAVHYKTIPIIDVAAGVLHLSWDVPGVAAPFVKDKRVKVIAIASPKRHPSFPDVPALSEFYPNLALSFWVALFAPKGTPPAIVDRLNREVTAATQTEAIRSSILSTGSLPLVLTPQELEKLVQRDLADAKKLVEVTKMSLD